MKSRGGFTLVEIMIVVLIIGILSAIAVPSFRDARERSYQNSCIANLKKIECAKEQFAFQNNLKDGDACLLSDLNNTFLTGDAIQTGACPGGGTITANPIGTPASCSIAGAYPHQIP